VENSYIKRTEENPLEFQLGRYYPVKCWDLAIINMHAGEKFEIACPSYYARGGQSFYSDVD